MKGETRNWLEYAEENLESAILLLDGDLFNPCLHNSQQAVEKMLKAVFVEFSLKFKKTHSINELAIALGENGLAVDLAEDECDLLDSIYLPSKYPLGSVLPDFEPDRKMCEDCIAIARRVRESVLSILHNK